MDLTEKLISESFADSVALFTGIEFVLPSRFRHSRTCALYAVDGILYPHCVWIRISVGKVS